jgi:tripartite-type tricarboxylate transporter receptor subunit TctC
MTFITVRRITLGRFALGCMALATVAFTLPEPVSAQAFPTRPVTIVVSQGTGSGSDISARILANQLSPVLGQPVVVENRTAGAGLVAHQQVARGPADGHTVIFSSTAALLIQPVINPAANYGLDDFAPVASVLRAAFVVLVANTPTAPRTIAELVATLRATPSAYASTGVGTLTHMASEVVLRRAGVQANHIPYRGSGQALADLMGGQVLFATDSLTAATPHITGGRLRALAVTGSQRESSLPDVPTLSEAGLPGPAIGVLGGLFAARGTPPNVLAALGAAVDKALVDPELVTRFAASQTEILREPREAFAQRLREEAPFWRQLVRDLDLKVE